ncbi:hypothetical protein NXF25_018872 [Crotalus adamanteus]|uniref:Uncharacterized protein n=1 Tax=Crotalus adamanteus TaxID=8729 RepID=A0AAW1B1Q6_CROAD
MALASQHFSS